MSEKLRRLDYFAHPFEKGNDIKLIDDIDLPNSLSLESLATQFGAANDETKKEQHAVEREEKSSNGKKKKSVLHKAEEEYDPFDFSNSIQY